MARQLTIEIGIEATRAKEEARQLEQGLKNLEAAAIKAGGATDKQTAAHEGLSRRLADAKARTRELEAEKKKLTTTTDQTTKASGLLTSAVLRYVSAGAIIAAIKHTADWADRFEELSKQTGLSITMLQKLDQVTKLNGTTIEVLTRAFGQMQDRIAGGDKSAVRAFEKLGLSFETFQRMRPDAQIENLAIAVMRIEDPMTRANVVTDLFGRTGVQLIPTLEQIAGGMDGVKVASEENIRAMAQLSDGWETAKFNAARLAVDGIGPMVRLQMDAADSTKSWTERMLAHLEMITQTYLGIGQLIRITREYYGVAMNGPGALPGVPDAPDMFDSRGTAPGDVSISGDASDFDKRIKGISDLYDAEIKRQQASARVAKDAADAAAEAAERASRAWAGQIEMQNRAFVDLMRVYNDYSTAQGGPLSAYRMITGQQAPVYLPTSNTGVSNVAMISPAIQGTDMSWLRQRPGFWRRQGNDLAGMQASWRQQNFGSLQGWVNSAQDWGYMGQDIMENGDPLVNATNVRGRGRRALAGALKGAEVGGRFGGPYGAMGGALVGLIVGAFRNPAFEDVWNRIAKNFGVEVSDELAKRIATQAKDLFKNNRQASEIYSLDAIIAEGGGVTDKNVNQLTARFRDAFSMREGGQFSQEQLTEVVEKNFGSFADHVVRSGKLASDQFLELIRLAKEFGVESQAIKEFIGGEATKVGDGLAAMLSPVLGTAVEVGSRVEEAQGKLKYLMASGKGDTEEYRAAQLELMEAIRHQGEVAQHAAGDLENIGVVALATFNKARENGLSFAEAIDAIAPTLDALALAQKGFGVESDNAALKQLQHYKDLVDQHRPLVEAAGALNETMLALSNIGGLNAETLAAMEDQGMRTFNRLIDAGFTENEALMQMGDFLGTVRDSHEKLGIPIDANTQHLIDQAEAQGILKTKAMDTNSILIEGLSEIIKAVGGKLPEAWDTAAKAAKDAANRSADDAQAAFDRVKPHLKVQVEYPDDYPGPTESPEGYAMGGVVRPRYAAMGMFVPRGTDTVPAMLTPGEGVLSRRGMRALGALNNGQAVGGQTFNITVHADNEDGGRAAARALMDELRRQGIKQRAYV